MAVRRTYADKVVEWIRGSNDFPYHFSDAQFRGRLLLPKGGTLGLTTYVGKDLLYHKEEPSQVAVFPTPGEPVPGDDDDESVTFDWGNRIAGLTLDQPVGSRTTLNQRLAYTRVSTHFAVPDQEVFLGQSVDEVQLAGSITHARDRHTIAAGYEAARYLTSYREQFASFTSDNDDFDPQDRIHRDRRRHPNRLRQNPLMRQLLQPQPSSHRRPRQANQRLMKVFKRWLQE